MYQRRRPILGITVLVVVAIVGWITPWKFLAHSLVQALQGESDDRPAWVIADGKIYRIALFPELFNAIGNKYGGDGKSNFAVPKIEEYDYLANDRFGAMTLFRCIATRKLEDNLPAATLGWCNSHAR